MRARAACFIFIAALAVVGCVGSAAAKTSVGSGVQLHKIVIDPKHPNVATIILDVKGTHKIFLFFAGGENQKPLQVSPKNLPIRYLHTGSGNDWQWNGIFHVPPSSVRNGRFILTLTYAPPLGQPGHGTCYVARLGSVDNKPLNLTREHCVNIGPNINI